MISILCLALGCFFLGFGLVGLAKLFTTWSDDGDGILVGSSFALAALFLIAAGVWR